VPLEVGDLQQQVAARDATAAAYRVERPMP